MNFEVGGTMRISARKLEVDVGETTKIISGTDMIMTANNIEEKANENIAIEATKSIYVDTKEYRERSVSHRTEEGTMEDSGSGGGLNYMNVNGNFVINNTDPEGSITLMSAGYVNIVAGKERVDITGEYNKKPSSMGMGTFTNIVLAGTTGAQDKSSVPGDYYFESAAGAYYNYAATIPGSSVSPLDGYKEDVTKGNRTRNVLVGKEDITIKLDQTVIAKKIYLN